MRYVISANVAAEPTTATTTSSREDTHDALLAQHTVSDIITDAVNGDGDHPLLRVQALADDDLKQRTMAPRATSWGMTPWR